MSDFARGLRSLDSVVKRLLGDEWRPEDDAKQPSVLDEVCRYEREHATLSQGCDDEEPPDGEPTPYDIRDDIEVLDFTHGDTLPAVERGPEDDDSALPEPGLGEGSIFDRYHS